MKGIVMDIKKGRAVVLCTDGKYVNTDNRGYTVGQEIVLRRPKCAVFAAAAACMLVFCGVGVKARQMYYTPASYVYVDTDSSIRLDINCFKRVISVVPLNDEASALLEAYPVTSKSTEECISGIVAACETGEDTDVEIGVVSADDKLKSRVSEVSDALTSESVAVEVSTASEETNDRALKLNVSTKRLEAIENFAEAFGTDVEAAAKHLKNVSVKEIYYRIYNKGKGTTAARTETEAQSSVSSGSEGEVPSESSVAESMVATQASETTESEADASSSEASEAESVSPNDSETASSDEKQATRKQSVKRRKTKRTGVLNRRGRKSAKSEAAPSEE